MSGMGLKSGGGGTEPYGEFCLMVKPEKRYSISHFERFLCFDDQSFRSGQKPVANLKKRTKKQLPGLSVI